MNKKSKKIRDAKHPGHVRKRGTEIKHVTTFGELDALFKKGYAGLIDFELDPNALAVVGNIEDSDEKVNADLGALYADFIKKTNDCYRNSRKRSGFER